MTKPFLKVFIAGGGTGGHITPGIALARECARRGVPAELIVGVRDRAMIPEDIATHTARLTPPSSVVKKLLFAFFFAGAFLKLLVLFLRERSPFAVIGMGGYVSLPALFAAYALRKPFYVCEQNSIPGKANRLMAGLARRVFLTFEKSKEYIPQGIVTGNPVREAFFMTDRRTARKKLGFKENDRALLIMGGSQGAKRLNEIVLEALPGVFKHIPNARVLWLTGRLHYDAVKNAVEEKQYTNVTLHAFYGEMETLIHACDAAITRAGSSSIAEIAVAGLPTLFVPFPFATDDHQYYNALEVARLGGAEVAREESLDKNTLLDIIGAMLLDSARNRSMRDAYAKGAAKNAAKAIVDVMLDDISLYSA